MLFSMRQIIYLMIQNSHLMITLSSVPCNLPLGTESKLQNPLQKKCKPSQKLNIKLYGCPWKRASVSISQEKENGSMTVEAALVMTLFLFGVNALFSLFSLTEFQIELQFAMEKAVREAAIYQMETQMGEAWIRHMVNQEIESVKGTLDFDKAGIVFIVDRDNENGSDILDATVVYRAGPKLQIFGSLKGTYRQRCRRRLWNGKEYVGSSAAGTADEEGEEYVYVTQNGSVFHQKRNCTYLQLSVRCVPAEALENCRNSSGSRYKPCEKCAGKTEMPLSLYITEDGTRYHIYRNCSGLNRWVMKIPFSETGGKSPCSRCSGG